MDCRGSLPNTPKSKEKESSLFSSINQLLDKWIYRRSQVLMERFFFFFLLQEKAGIAIKTLAHSPYGKKYDRF